MRVILDFETFWDTKDKYSLKNMKTIDYVRDPRFEAHGAGVQIDDGEPFWVPKGKLQAFFDSLPWGEITLVGHNLYFDGLVLWEHYGKQPKFYHDTLSMARAIIPFAPKGHGLGEVDKLLGGDGKVPGLKETNGLRTEEMSAEVYEVLSGDYGLTDIRCTDRVYNRLVALFPSDELELMSITLRWGCVPVVQLDVEAAKEALDRHNKKVKEIVKAGGVPVKTLTSNPKFAEFIQDTLGLEPPIKLNSDDEETWAFSKSDLAFQEFMANHPEHSHIWAARLAAKSNIDRTRLEALIKIGMGGCVPMPLKYAGAHTLRWSGGDRINPQNWPREGDIRRCIMAPPGYNFIVFDQKQIELRMNMWFCGELEWLRICHEDDIYKVTAANHYKIEDKESYDWSSEEGQARRFFGKTIELGLGYGMGWKKFRNQCALKEIYLSEAEAFHVVNEYRNSRPRVPQMQALLNQAIMAMYTGEEMQIGPVRFVKNGAQLPNGMTLDYSGLEPLPDGNWVYGKEGRSAKGKSYKKKIYGGLLLENIIQALARLVMAQNILDIEREVKNARLVTTTHDEAAAIAREEHTEECFAAIQEIMGRSPWWAPDLPLVGEGKVDVRYAK